MKIFFSALLFFSNITFASDIRVLMYHRISNDFPVGDTVISTKNFKNHLDIIKKHGYNTATVAQLQSHLEGKKLLPKHTVVITFDDGWKDNYNAAKELHSRNMAGTFYVVSGVIDRHPWYLTSNQIKYMANLQKIEIGSHTHTHFVEWETKLDSIDDRTIIGEMFMSKYILENIIKKPVKSFAWPYGYARKGLTNFFKSAGYTNMALVGNHYGFKNEIVNFERTNVDGRCSPEEVIEIIKSNSKCNFN